VRELFRGGAEPARVRDESQEHAASFDGSPPPADGFRLHMPSVERNPDPDALFAKAHAQLSNPEPLAGDDVEGRRAIAVVTPERQIMLLPCPAPGSMPDEYVAPVKALMPPETPLKSRATG
jgi:hypothetical protein